MIQTYQNTVCVYIYIDILYTYSIYTHGTMCHISMDRSGLSVFLVTGWWISWCRPYWDSTQGWSPTSRPPPATIASPPRCLWERDLGRCSADDWYPFSHPRISLWWFNVAMENHNIYNGKSHYFYGHFQYIAMLNYQSVCIIQKLMAYIPSTIWLKIHV